MAIVNRKVRRFTDFDLSFAANPVTKDILFSNNESAVKQSIRNLIQTINYEKKFHPEIGCQITGLLFENFDPKMSSIMKRTIEDTINSFKAPTDLASNMKSAFDSSSLLDKPTISNLQAVVEQQQIEKSLGQKIMDYGVQQKDNLVSAVKDFDLGETVTSNLTSGIESGLQQKGAELIVGKKETPDANYTSINMASLMSPNAAQGIFDTVDLAVQNNIGNPYQIRAIQNYDYITSGLIQDENSWFQNRQHAMRVMGMGEAI